VDVNILLRRHGMPFSRCVHPPVFGSERVAAMCHTPGQNVVKSVLVSLGGRYVLCVLPACRRLDLDRVAKVCFADVAWVASEYELGNVFHDCECGAQPPFGKPYGLMTIMDESLRANEYIVFPAGAFTETYKMLLRDYEYLAEPVVARIAYQREPVHQRKAVIPAFRL